jgi:hypothetical protein
MVKDRGVAKSFGLVATWERVSRARKQTPVEWLACSLDDKRWCLGSNRSVSKNAHRLALACLIERDEIVDALMIRRRG